MSGDTVAPAVSARSEAMQGFLQAHGWHDADHQPLASDASPRRYVRLVRGEDRALVMDARQDLEAHPCPPDATPAQRAALGYQAQARLAGHDIAAFAGLAKELTMRGYSAPMVLGADEDAGFVLLEDLGDALFQRVLDAGADLEPLYGAAIDVLAAIRRATFPNVVRSGARAWPLLSYDETALLAEAELLVQWYLPRLAKADKAQAHLSPQAHAAWRSAWQAAFAALEGEEPALVLRDVHAENLIWLPEREDTAKAGLLDFQDALFGHPAYDVASLLEDARRDVPEDLAQAMIERYLARAYVRDPEAFRAAYAVLAAQRNAKILGVFVRLHERDGKPGYLSHLPRVARNFARNLRQPALEGVRSWFAAYAPAVLEGETP